MALLLFNFLFSCSTNPQTTVYAGGKKDHGSESNIQINQNTLEKNKIAELVSGEVPLKPEKKILLRSEPMEKPEWVDTVPQSALEFFFVGTSQPFDTAANARDNARENARNQVLKFYGEYIESRAIDRNTISGSTRDTLAAFVNREDEIRSYAQNVISQIGTDRYYTEVYLNTDNKEEYVVYTLCQINRQKAEDDITNFAKNISERYTNQLPQNATLKVTLEGCAAIAKALEGNPLHRITAYYNAPGGPVGLYEYVQMRINELANSISIEPIPFQTIQKTETLKAVVRLKSTQIPDIGPLDCQVSLHGNGIDSNFAPRRIGEDNSLLLSVNTNELEPGRYTVQIELLLQELSGGIAKNSSEGFSFDVTPLNVVLKTSDDMEAGIKRAVDTLSARLQVSTETIIGPFTLTRTDIPTGLSRYLTERVTHYAKNNQDRKYRVVDGDRDNKTILSGFFSKRNDLVDVTLELSTPDGSGDGSQIFSLSVTELARLGISIEPENQKTIQEREQIFSGLIDRNNNQATQNIHIQAWFDSESRTYLHRDELKMTVKADQDCYFKIVHIDVNNQMKMIYPNSNDTNNFLKANTSRSVFENAKYYLYGPYGTEKILVVASTEQFKNIEQDYITPWTTATAETIEKVTAPTGGDLELDGKPIVSTREGEVSYSISILKPHDEYEYRKPENMEETVQSIRGDVLRQGGVFDGNDQSGYYILNGIRGSYRIPREKPDTLQFAIYYLDNYSGGSNAGVMPRGSGGYTFSFEKPKDISQAIQAVRSGIEGTGGTFSGNEQEGNFKASGITGQYRVSDLVNVTIIEKPFLIPNSRIEKEVKNYFGGR